MSKKKEIEKVMKKIHIVDLFTMFVKQKRGFRIKSKPLDIGLEDKEIWFEYSIN